MLLGTIVDLQLRSLHVLFLLFVVLFCVGSFYAVLCVCFFGFSASNFTCLLSFDWSQQRSPRGLAVTDTGRPDQVIPTFNAYSFLFGSNLKRLKVVLLFLAGPASTAKSRPQDLAGASRYQLPSLRCLYFSAVFFQYIFLFFDNC